MVRLQPGGQPGADELRPSTPVRPCALPAGAAEAVEAKSSQHGPRTLTGDPPSRPGIWGAKRPEGLPDVIPGRNTARAPNPTGKGTPGPSPETSRDFPGPASNRCRAFHPLGPGQVSNLHSAWNEPPNPARQDRWDAPTSGKKNATVPATAPTARGKILDYGPVQLDDRNPGFSRQDTGIPTTQGR